MSAPNYKNDLIVYTYIYIKFKKKNILLLIVSLIMNNK